MNKRILLPTLMAFGAISAVAQAQQPGAMLLTQWDDNADGRVTLGEARQRRSDMFEMFDHDSNGSLSAAEIDGVASFRSEMQAAAQGAMGAQRPGMGQGRGAGQGQGRGAGRGRGQALSAAGDLRPFDTNGDGTLTQAEFVQGTDAWFAMMDRNGDSVVTAEDFGRRR